MSAVTEVEEKLFHAFLLNISKILSGYTTLQRTLGPLSKRDENFINDYKHFIAYSKRYNKNFYVSMFTMWIQDNMVDVNLIFEPIRYRFENDDTIYIGMDIIHEWGLRIEDKRFIRNLEIIILRMIVLYHQDESTIKEAKERLNELQPPTAGPSSGLLGSDGKPSMQNITNLVGTMTKSFVSSIRNNPDLKDQIPSDDVIDSMMSKITNMEALGDITSSIQDGSIMTKGGEIITKLMQDKELQGMFGSEGSEAGSGSGSTVKTFSDIPAAIMPPGEPVNPDAPIPSLALSSQAVISTSVTNSTQEEME